MVPMFVILNREAAMPNDESQLDRIERKLDILIRALGEGEELDLPTLTLDGDESGHERDQSQPL